MLHPKIAARWDLVNSVDAQLYSFTLAENGIEHVRTLTSAVDFDSLLREADVHSGSGFPEWSNPIPLEKARTFDPGSWTPGRDDGIPFQGESLVCRLATPLPAGATSSCVSPTTPQKIRVATRIRSSCYAPWASPPFRFPTPCSLVYATASP